MTGREFIARQWDERPSSSDFTDEGLQFWLHYYGKPKLFQFGKTRFEKDLMAVSGRDYDQLFRLREGSEMEPAILEQISTAYQQWQRQ